MLSFALVIFELKVLIGLSRGGIKLVLLLAGLFVLFPVGDDDDVEVVEVVVDPVVEGSGVVDGVVGGVVGF